MKRTSPRLPIAVPATGSRPAGFPVDGPVGSRVPS
jgi:hypothetical protein